MQQIEKLKQFIIESSKDKSFIHNEWFIKYHLNLVEQIALELCDIYKDANRNMVQTLVWIHDYGKIIGLNNLDEIKVKIDTLLNELEFEGNFVKSVIEKFDLIERKEEVDLNTAPIEVKIVSSSDGASHFVGPFFQIYLYENSGKPLDELMASNLLKVNKDWERKIVLPEVKKAIEERKEFVLESNGILPTRFIF